MTKTKFTIAVMVIGMLMLLVLPVCGVSKVDTVTPDTWINGTDLDLHIIGSDFPTISANVRVILNKTGQQNQTSTSALADTGGLFVNAGFGSPKLMFGYWNVSVVNISDPSTNFLQAGDTGNLLFVDNDPPTLTAITPNNWAFNNSAFDFTLTGTGFFTRPTVNLSLASYPYTNITATSILVNTAGTSITGTFPLTDVQAGSYTVNLTNPDGKISVTPPLTLPFTVYCPAPTITNVYAGTPSNVRFITNDIANSAAHVTVIGTGFRNGVVVNITNGSVQVPVLPIGTPEFFPNGNPGTEVGFFANFSGQQVGLYNVTVRNPGPAYNNTTQTNYFTVKYPAAPIVSSITPNQWENISNVSVVIVGQNFYPGAVVILTKAGQPDIPVVPASPFVINDLHTTISCNLTTNGTVIGARNVVVTNNDTQSGSYLNGFTVTAPPGPTALFSTIPTPATGPVPLLVAFNDTSTGSPTAWTWKFGDGTTYTAPDFAHRNTTHTYAASGTYQANLTVSNVYGSSTSANQAVTPYIPWVTPPGGPTDHTVAIDGDANNMYIAAVSGGYVYFNSYNYSVTQAWTGWVPLGLTNLDPTIAVAGGYVHIVAICPNDNGLYTMRYNIVTGAWSGWESLMGPTLYPPALIAGTSPTLGGVDHLFLAARGTDNAVYVKQWTTATGWTGFFGSSDWTPYGGNIQSSPALAFAPSTTGTVPDHANVLTISARNIGDNVVYTKDIGFSPPVYYYAESPWAATSLSSLNTPSVTRGITGTSKAPLYVVVQGTDNIVRLQKQTGSTWSTPSSLGSSTTNRPAIYMDLVNNRISTVITGTPDAYAYVSFFDCALNTNSAWQSLGTLLLAPANNPSFSSGYSAGSSPYIAVRGADSLIYLKNIVYG